MASAGNRVSRVLVSAAFVTVVRGLAAFVCVFFLLVIGILAAKSSLLFGQKSIGDLLFTTEWSPARGDFGFLPIIAGSVAVTLLAMVIAVPVSVFASIYIAEYMHARLRNLVKAFVDVLAGIPSVVFGMCGIIVLVPFVRDTVAPFFGTTSTGFCLLSASLVLSVMVFPIIISVCVDCFRAVPIALREVSFAVGATKLEVTKLVVLRAALPGVFSAVLLGFGRAFGETIAVAMLVGNLPRMPGSLFDSATTLPSIIVSTYGELMSVPLYDSAMMFLALVLIAVVLLFGYVSRVVRNRFQGRPER